MLSPELNAAIRFLVIMWLSSPLIEAMVIVIGITLAAIHYPGMALSGRKLCVISERHCLFSSSGPIYETSSDIALFQASENNMHPTTL